MRPKKFFKAIEVDDLEKVKYQLEANEVPKHTKQDMMYIAAEKNNLDLMKCVVEHDPSLTTRKEDPNYSVLERAVWHGSLDVVKYLVEEHKANIFVRYPNRVTHSAIHLAIQKDHLDVLKYFIEERNADVNEPIWQRPTLISEAVQYKRHNITKYLIEEKNADLTRLNKNGESILYPAAYHGDLDFIKYVLDEKKAKIDLNWGDTQAGTTLVMRVAFWPDRFDILKYLVGEKHADVNIPDKLNHTPLHCARSKEACQYLIQQGAHIDSQTKDGDTPLHRAVHLHNYDEIVQCLIENGANVNQRNNIGMTPLNKAVGNLDWYNTSNYLIEHGADINLGDNCGNTPLHTAVFGWNTGTNYDYKLCEFLLKHGAEVNKANNEGRPPLEYAVRYTHHKLCTLLVNYGADVNKKNNDGETVVHHVAKTDRLDILNYLVDEQYADVNVNRKGDNMTPLHIAAAANNYKICEYLVEKGANIHSEDRDGRNPGQRATQDHVIKYFEKISLTRNRRCVDFFSTAKIMNTFIRPPEILEIEASHKMIHLQSKNTSLNQREAYISSLHNFFPFVQLLIGYLKNADRKRTSSSGRTPLKQTDLVAEEVIDTLLNFHE